MRPSLLRASSHYCSLVAITTVTIVAFALCSCQDAKSPTPSCGDLNSWSFYGGSWSSHSGILEATRNGRGDMALSQNNAYSNFHLSVQMQLRDLYPDTIYGDAGILFRVSNPHIGVDSYDGYYTGIRASDQHLFLGRVDEEWHQLLTTPMAEPLIGGAWYSFQISAQGCAFLISVAPAHGGSLTTLRYLDPHCRQSGSVGMRVYYAKASWRLLRIIER